MAAPPTLLSACAFRSTLEGVLDVDGPAPVESGVETPTSSASGDGVEGADPKTPEASGPASPPAPAPMLGAIPVPAAVPRLLARVGATGVDVVEARVAPAGAELRAVDLGVGEFVDDAAPPVLGPRVMPRVDGGSSLPARSASNPAKDTCNSVGKRVGLATGVPSRRARWDRSGNARPPRQWPMTMVRASFAISSTYASGREGSRAQQNTCQRYVVLALGELCETRGKSSGIHFFAS